MFAGLFKRNKSNFKTVERVAKERRCCVRTIYGLIARGVLPPLQARSAVEDRQNDMPRPTLREKLEGRA